MEGVRAVSSVGRGALVGSVGRAPPPPPHMVPGCFPGESHMIPGCFPGESHAIP